MHQHFIKIFYNLIFSRGASAPPVPTLKSPMNASTVILHWVTNRIIAFHTCALSRNKTDYNHNDNYKSLVMLAMHT